MADFDKSCTFIHDKSSNHKPHRLPLVEGLVGAVDLGNEDDLLLRLLVREDGERLVHLDGIDAVRLRHHLEAHAQLLLVVELELLAQLGVHGKFVRVA